MRNNGKQMGMLLVLAVNGLFFTASIVCMELELSQYVDGNSIFNMNESAHKFGCFGFSAGAYYYLYNADLFKGSVDCNERGVRISLNDFCNTQNDRKEILAKLVNHYRIYLMPKAENMQADVEYLLTVIQKNKDLQEAIHLVALRKLGPVITLHNSTSVVMPKIVVYCARGKDNAQATLNMLYAACKDKQGLDIVPRFSKKITSYLYYTQGNGDDKTVEAFRSVFEQPDMVHYRFDVTGIKQNYHLTMPGE